MTVTKRTTIAVLLGVLLLCWTACHRAGTPTNGTLEGTSWTLIAYRKTRPIAGTTITALFQGGQVSGSAGCNSYRGPYTISGNTITVGALATTKMACLEPGGTMAQESLFLELLQDAQTFRLSDGQLQIYSSEHDALTFEQKE
jgi:heat shock protein HslJ